MRRPEDRRTKQLNIGLTESEHAELLSRAARAGMRPVDYGRLKLLGRGLARAAETAAHILDPLLIVQLSRLGNNLNQIARKLHQFGQTPPPSLEGLLRELRELMRRAASHGP